ncbi:MAG: hypothetical protein AABY36_06635 [Campylobacterota bacterium]
MSDIEHRCKELLAKNGVNIDSEIDFDINGDIHTLSFEYIIDTFMTASDSSRTAFLASLQKALESKNEGARKFFEGMGQLLLMTHLSKNIETP